MTNEMCIVGGVTDSGMPMVTNDESFTHPFMVRIEEIGVQVIDGELLGGKFKALVVAIPLDVNAEMVTWTTKKGNKCSLRKYGSCKMPVSADIAEEHGIHPETTIDIDVSQWGPRAASGSIQSVAPIPCD